MRLARAPGWARYQGAVHYRRYITDRWRNESEVEIGVRLRVALTDIVLISTSLSILARAGENRQLPPISSTQVSRQSSPSTADSRAEEELQKGTSLTRAASFAEAIPHLLAARGRASNEY